MGEDVVTTGRAPSAAEQELARARLLVEEATDALRQRDEELARLQSLLEGVLAETGPLAVLEGEVVRAWSGALEELTGVPAHRAVGRRATKSLPEGLVDGSTWRDQEGRAWRVRVVTHDGWQVAALSPLDRRTAAAATDAAQQAEGTAR